MNLNEFDCRNKAETLILQSPSLLIGVQGWGNADLCTPGEERRRESTQKQRVDASLNERDGDRQLPLSPHDLPGPLSVNVLQSHILTNKAAGQLSRRACQQQPSDIQTALEMEKQI